MGRELRGHGRNVVWEEISAAQQWFRRDAGKNVDWLRKTVDSERRFVT